MNKIAEILKKSDNILIISHKKPDGDTLGSAFALCYTLLDMGKNCAVTCLDKVTPKYLFLSEGKEKLDFDFRPDLVISVDCASSEMIDKELIEKYGVDICIDHHEINGNFARYSYVEKDSAAVGEIIFNLINLLTDKISKKVADCLYTAISTDTGCFRYSNTTDRTLLIASKLVELGADNKKLNKLLFETVTKAQFEIERKAFETINFYYDGKIATMKITQKMLLETGATPDDIDNISSLPRKIEGVEAAITLRENPDGSIKVSARSGEKVDVSKVCKDVCSGGGHKRAAGGTIFSDIEKAEKLFIEYFKEVF